MPAPMNRGNVWLRAIMAEVAWASVKTKASYFYAQFHRIARRRGRNKAAIAVAHSLLTAVYHVLRTGQPYAELSWWAPTVGDRGKCQAFPQNRDWNAWKIGGLYV
jgi:hypothetical protein